MLDSDQVNEKSPLFKFTIGEMSFSGVIVVVPGKSPNEAVDILVCNKRMRAINRSNALHAQGKRRNMVRQKVLKSVSSWVLRPKIACGRYP